MKKKKIKDISQFDEAAKKAKPIMPIKRPKYSFHDEMFVRECIMHYFNDKEYEYLIEDLVDHAIYNLRQEYATTFEEVKSLVYSDIKECKQKIEEELQKLRFIIDSLRKMFVLERV